MSTGAIVLAVYLAGWLVSGIVWGFILNHTNMTTSDYFDRHFDVIVLTVAFWPAAAVVLIFVGALMLPVAITRWVLEWLGL